MFLSTHFILLTSFLGYKRTFVVYGPRRETVKKYETEKYFCEARRLWLGMAGDVSTKSVFLTILVYYRYRFYVLRSSKECFAYWSERFLSVWCEKGIGFRD